MMVVNILIRIFVFADSQHVGNGAPMFYAAYIVVVMTSIASFLLTLR